MKLLLLAACLAGPVPVASTQTAPCGTTELCQWIEQPNEYRPEIRSFYQTLGHRPAWSNEALVSGRAIELMTLLTHAAQHGLEPSRYRVSTPNSPAGFIRFDVGLTAAALRFLGELRLGRFNSTTYRSAAVTAAERAELPAILHRFLERGNPSLMIQETEPPFPEYRRTREALPRYRTLAAENQAPRLPIPRAPVKPGQNYSALAGLVERLRREGDLAPDEPELPETYTGVVVDAAKRFQARHGLAPDGLLGNATFAQLNVSAAHRVTQLELALERWRWVPRTFARPPLIVNLPEFVLRTYDAALEPESEFRIVAGQALRNATPVFASEIRSVTFRPYWNVPARIQREEIAPALDKDDAYLKRNQLEALSSGGEALVADPVSPELRAAIKSGQVRLRQLPGPGNSLGLVRFEIPNPYGVYLHDTPAQALFQHSRRDFSHGCMRVENAVALAGLVLAEEPGWDRQMIAQAAQGSATVHVTVSRPPPLLVTYSTAVVLRDGTVRFLADIYGWDAKLIPRTTSLPLRGSTPSPQTHRAADTLTGQ